MDDVIELNRSPVWLRFITELPLSPDTQTRIGSQPPSEHPSPSDQLSKDIGLLPHLVGATADERSYYQVESMPPSVSQNYNAQFNWQIEPSITLQQATSSSMQSAKNIAKVCSARKYSSCISNPLEINTKNYGLSVQYKDKVVVTWYSKINRGEEMHLGTTFFAEFSSIDNKQAVADSVYSMKGLWIPSGQYDSLELLQITVVGYYSGGGQECVSGTCSFPSLLIKNHNIIAINSKTEVAMNRYGGGSSCIVLDPEAVLLCSSQDWNTQKETFHSTSLR